MSLAIFTQSEAFVSIELPHTNALEQVFVNGYQNDPEHETLKRYEN